MSNPCQFVPSHFHRISSQHSQFGHGLLISPGFVWVQFIHEAVYRTCGEHVWTQITSEIVYEESSARRLCWMFSFTWWLASTSSYFCPPTELSSFAATSESRFCLNKCSIRQGSSTSLIQTLELLSRGKMCWACKDRDWLLLQRARLISRHDWRCTSGRTALGRCAHLPSSWPVARPSP